MKAKQKTSTSGLSYKTLSMTAWAFPGLVVLVVIVATLFVLIPQLQQLMDERSVVEGKEDELEQLVEKRTFLGSLEEFSLTSDLEDVTRALPDQKPVFIFLSSFMGLVDEIEDLEIGMYDFSPGNIASESAEAEQEQRSEREGLLTFMPIEVGLDGNLDNILDLMGRIEEMAPLADVYGFALSGDLNDEDAGDDQRGITMQLNLYYSYPPKNIAKPNQSVPVMSEADKDLIGVLAEMRLYEGVEEFDVESLFDQEREDIFNF